MTVINALISFGLLLLYMPSYRIWDWNPPFRASKTIIFVYFLSNLFLVIVPFFPPASRTYEKLPYWVCYFSFFLCTLQTLISCFTVAFNGKRHRHIPWYHILVYMGYLASKKEWISSSARVGYWGRWCLSIRIPPSTLVCGITVTIYLSNRHGWCRLVRTVGQVVLDTSHIWHFSLGLQLFTYLSVVGSFKLFL